LANAQPGVLKAYFINVFSKRSFYKIAYFEHRRKHAAAEAAAQQRAKK
jgi:hypothetical protein